jgi:hypothetical protein
MQTKIIKSSLIKSEAAVYVSVAIRDSYSSGATVIPLPPVAHFFIRLVRSSIPRDALPGAPRDVLPRRLEPPSRARQEPLLLVVFKVIVDPLHIHLRRAEQRDEEDEEKHAWTR